MIKSIFFCALIGLLFSCQLDKKNMTGDNILLFKGSNCWELAKAVESEDSIKINKIIKEKKINVDCREDKFGQSLLIWAVRKNKYNSVKYLLKNGANPNLQDNYDGNSAVMKASGFGENYNTETRTLELLLRYGGDSNTEQKISRRKGSTTRKNPLIIASGCCFQKVKILVEKGANINYVNEFGESPLETALHSSKEKIVEYLLIKKNADYKTGIMVRSTGDTLKMINLLRNWRFPLNSEEYKTKMKIVDYLKGKGENYWDSPIPKKIKENYSKEYLEKY